MSKKKSFSVFMKQWIDERICQDSASVPSMEDLQKRSMHVSLLLMSIKMLRHDCLVLGIILPNW